MANEGKKKKTAVKIVRKGVREDKHGIASLVAGGIIMAISNMEWVNKQEFIKDPKNWWAKGVIIVLLGYLLRRKGQKWAKHGSALMAVGGALLIKGYQDKEKGTTAGVTSGPMDDIMQGYWTTAANGQQLFIPYSAAPQFPMPSAAPQFAMPRIDDTASRIADRIYSYSRAA